MIIKNKTDLSFELIGSFIDTLMENNQGNTMYYGKVELGELEYGGKKIMVKIRYLKRYVEWIFWYKENK